ncbi:IclR family transcriptional regulator [Paraferrimonas sp. SM1919]|uniref:IclR family transcriptional regulator n=1 Tax=Paraferrimonas sp. SM1919 TaxID=2662263 RepID=UPI0013D60216|nr:IclR family transcriptional regulator [Paraferrimonas sp. SM1919]
MAAKEPKKYSAPALEKGLDIIELLSAHSSTLSISDIAEHLGRTNAEIYRMILVLEQRGYLVKSKHADGYQITRKLLQLGTEQEPVKDVLEHARVVMPRLANITSMACHIAVESQEQIVVISSVETPASLSYSVRVGYRRPIIQSASGKVIFGFQNAEKKEAMMSILERHHSKAELTAFLTECKKVVKQGYFIGESGFVKAVTDISVPIFDGDQVVAALTIPFIERTPEKMPIKQVVEELKKAGEFISKSLTYGLLK